MLLDKNNLDEQILQSLIINKVSENKELEYKDYTFSNGKYSSIGDKERDKLVKEIAAFANTNGGVVVIGIKEDENRLPIELSGSGITRLEFDDWLSSFRQVLLAKIRPHLHGVDCIPVELSNGSLAIVIFVVKSFSRPHSFWDGNKDEFNIRYANGIAYMDIDDLRKEFLYSEVTRSRIETFRKDRISMILASDIIGDMGNDAKLVLHIIPEWSFELGNSVNLSELSKTEFRPISGSGWNYRYNADGFCIYGIDSTTKRIDNYAQMFHNGIVETVEIRLLSDYKENQVYDWDKTQGAIIQATSRYGKILTQFSIPKPWHLFAVILNAKGYYTLLNGWYDSEILDRQIINSLDGIWNENDTVGTALKPLLDSLSHAFGCEKSNCYDIDGNLITKC